jgi:O-antigen/teichoic acid export membrane protein
MSDRILKRIVQGAGLSAVKLASGLVKIKALALLLGVSGVGTLSLALQFQQTIIYFVSMSLGVGVINLGRPRLVAGDPAGADRILGTALGVVAINATAFLVAFAAFYGPLSRLVRPDGGVPPDMWPVAFAAVIGSFTPVIWEGLAFASDRFDLYVKANIAGAVLDAVLFIAATALFGLQGAVAATVISAALLFTVNAMLIVPVARKVGLLRRPSFDLRDVGPALSVGATTLVALGAVSAAQFGARSYVAATAGTTANGYLQVSTALAAYLAPFVTNGVWGHLHPIAAAEGDNERARTELRAILGHCVRLAVAGALGAVIVAPILVPLAYTHSFAPAAGYLPVYFCGEIFFLTSQVGLVYLLGVSARYRFIALNLIYAGALIAGTIFTHQVMHLTGAWPYVAAHAGAATAMAVSFVVLNFRRNLIDRRTLASTALWVALGVAALISYAIVAARGWPLLASLPPAAVAGGALVSLLRSGRGVATGRLGWLLRLGRAAG